ncbi:hypothetical protein CJF42_16110 [Pseudoalteromonas sp. NBT06-2]|uniref:hypothetical protein n=1 Tax=Pseudoalteromonas sp. NBT06-2 TaxID=2025950 RepID=UPI000BA67D22|nr:hypothetical protein [Pseudoalteromonas sp. NBT06-2]PAJ73388.1 hypothetical protein CJF42_16110 [Pseudoalteromonas sp. NBT06-2]
MKLAIKLLFSIITVIFLSACSSTSVVLMEKEDDVQFYQIYIDEEGRLLEPKNEKKIPRADEKKYIRGIIANYDKLKKQKPELELTIFIHGGLNSHNTATSRVQNLKQEMLDDNKYPLFLSWNSGPFTNYIDHLLFLRNGEESKFLGPISSPFILLEDLFRSVARIPASTYRILFSQNAAIKSYNSKEEIEYGNALKNVDDASFLLHNSPNDTGFAFTDWFSVINPTKLVSSPFIDGLGKGAWNSMLRRTDLVLINDSSHKGVPLQNATTAANLFFEMFYSAYKNDENINLIGHSMGTVVANNILSQYQHIDFDNIVYLAAACSIKDLNQVVHPYLLKNKQSTFYNVTLNPYNDMTENLAYDFTPRGSLLMWIDQFLEDTNSFSDKTAGFWFNIIRGAVKAFPDREVQKRVHLTQFGLRDGSPEKHGDFSEYLFWNEDFWRGDYTGGSGKKSKP